MITVTHTPSGPSLDGPTLKKVPKDEWLAEAKKRFGDDPLNWKFVCPSCGHIQSCVDFRPYKDKGADPNDAYFSCIGRFDGHMKTSMLSGESPCNYTLGGLFVLATTVVVLEDGRQLPVFEFAPPAEGGAA